MVEQMADLHMKSNLLNDLNDGGKVCQNAAALVKLNKGLKKFEKVKERGGAAVPVARECNNLENSMRLFNGPRTTLRGRYSGSQSWRQ